MKKQKGTFLICNIHIPWLNHNLAVTFKIEIWCNFFFFFHFCIDTFASKVAAIQDSTADNSVGNVTGSNAVNVFLGIGIAWSIAALYHAFHGNKFKVDPGKWVY